MLVKGELVGGALEPQRSAVGTELSLKPRRSIRTRESFGLKIRFGDVGRCCLVSVFVIFSPVGMLMILSVTVSSINGCCLPALSHCLGDQIRK